MGLLGILLKGKSFVMNAAFATITPNFKNDNSFDNRCGVVISNESAVTKASIDGEVFLWIQF
ncbi:MAG: hypothetical protein WBI98_11235 [Tepidanaerobacteraceae bacterium]